MNGGAILKPINIALGAILGLLCFFVIVWAYKYCKKTADERKQLLKGCSGSQNDEMEY